MAVSAVKPRPIGRNFLVFSGISYLLGALRGFLGDKRFDFLEGEQAAALD
jgi:hypothetical protein